MATIATRVVAIANTITIHRLPPAQRTIALASAGVKLASRIDAIW